MMQIHSKSNEFPLEHIKLQIDDPDLDIVTASELAKAKARELNKDAMLLSWYCRKTGEFAPKFECGYQKKPPWIIFAEARGGNLTIDINYGEYVFIYLKL
jgi:hypothetical protein